MTTNPPPPRVVEASRIKDGVMITFDDGRCAIYSAKLLYAIYADASPIDPDLALPIAE